MTKSAQDGPRGIILLILSSKITIEHLRLVWAFSAELLLDYPKPLADGRSDSRIWNRTLRPDTKANSTFAFSPNARYYSQKAHSELAKRTIWVPETAKMLLSWNQPSLCYSSIYISPVIPSLEHDLCACWSIPEESMTDWQLYSQKK